MYHLDGLTHEEIGEQLGLSRSAITKKLHRFHETLKARIGVKA
jgi:DNA-directed RNA polymerase specialized sigma24 family protein